MVVIWRCDFLFVTAALGEWPGAEGCQSRRGDRWFRGVSDTVVIRMMVNNLYE